MSLTNSSDHRDLPGFNSLPNQDISRVHTAKDEPSDALIFITGLDGAAKNMQLGFVSETICAELDRRAGDDGATFSVERKTNGREAFSRVYRTRAGQVTPITDVYTFDPIDASGQTSAGTAPGWKPMLSLGLTVLAGIAILSSAGTFRRNRRAKSFAHKIQLGFCLIVLLCLGAYLIVVFVALIATAYAALRGSTGAPTVSWPQWVVLIGAASAALFPKLREKLSGVANLYLGMVHYFFVSSVRNRLTGELRGLIDRINRRPEPINLHLVGYSFGSLVLLDTIFSKSSEHPAIMRNVTTITTVGCPFDLVRMLQPSYPLGRARATQSEPAWLNIFEPIDALGSNFADGDDVGSPATSGVILSSNGDGALCKPDSTEAWNPSITLNLGSFLMLGSLTGHSSYWSEDSEAETAWGLVIDNLEQIEPNRFSCTAVAVK